MARSGWSVFRTKMGKLLRAKGVRSDISDLAKVWNASSDDVQKKYGALAAGDNKRTKAAAARVRAERMTRSRTHKVHVSSPLSKDISSALQAAEAEADSDSDSESFCSRTSCAPCSSFMKPSRGPFPPATALPASCPVPPANMTTEEAARYLHRFYHESTEPPEGLQDEPMEVFDFSNINRSESDLEPHPQFQTLEAWAKIAGPANVAVGQQYFYQSPYN